MFINKSGKIYPIEYKISETHKSFRDIEENILHRYYNEKDVRGTYKNLDEIQDYYLILMYMQLMEKKTASWSTIVKDFKLEEIRDALACKGLNLDDFLVAFGFPKLRDTDSITEGINSQTIGGDNPITIGVSDYDHTITSETLMVLTDFDAFINNLDETTCTLLETYVDPYPTESRVIATDSENILYTTKQIEA